MPKITKKTDTETDTKPVRGIRYLSDPARHNAPWMLTTFIEGRKVRTFWPTKTAALEEQSERRRSDKKHGTEAHAYDRTAHAEYEDAKRKLNGRPLSEAVDFFTQRNALGTPEAVPTIAEASAHLVELKRSLKRADRTVDDLESRLGAFSRAFGIRLISTITRNEILDWLIHRKDKSARTTRNMFSALHNLFAYAERRGWILSNPCGKIDTSSDLPTLKKSRVSILTVPQGHGVLHAIEAHFVKYIHWALLKYFASARSEEANRFQGEWIDMKQHRICIPGWFMDGDGEHRPGSKTRDDWVIDQLDPCFWQWLERYPVPAGPIPHPSNRQWKAMKKYFATAKGSGHLPKWPHNGWRHSFATYDLSAHRDQTRTSLILRHQSPRKLWSNYLAHIIPAPEAKRYFKILPSL